MYGSTYTSPVTTPLLVAGPSAEPVTLGEAKEWIRQPHNYDDAVITGTVKAAREWFETACDKGFTQATWDYKFPSFYPSESGMLVPRGWMREIVLPYPPLVSVVSVTYIDTADVLQTLASSVYEVVTSRTPGVISLGWSQVWPTVGIHPEAVTIRFISGQTQPTCPELVKTGIKMLAAFWLADRGDALALTRPDVPPPVKAMAIAAGAYRF